MPQPNDTDTKTTIMLPARLRRWLRHYMADHDVTLKDLVLRILTDWARQQGYDPDVDHEKPPSP